MPSTNHKPVSTVGHTPRQKPASTPTLFTACRDLWRSAPDDFRRDTVAMFLLSPLLLGIAAIAWVMLP